MYARTTTMRVRPEACDDLHRRRVAGLHEAVEPREVSVEPLRRARAAGQREQARGRHCEQHEGAQTSAPEMFGKGFKESV